MSAKFEINKGQSGKFQFHLRADGQIIARARNRGYKSKAAAEKGIESVKAKASGAAVVDNSDMPWTPECPGTRSSGRINTDSFTGLDAESDARQLIMHGFDRANDALTEGDPFESFICAWIAFNSWAALCSRIDQDRDQLNAIESDDSLQSGFKALLRDSNFAGRADEFRKQWPIFKAAEIRRKHVRRVSRDRRECSEHYREKGINRAPPCYYERHIDANELCTLDDWPHTLEAIYQVRCNLFHGEKRAGSEEDETIVEAAANTLVPVLKWLLDVPEEGPAMSDQPDAHHQEWAARLNVEPELVADAERIAGKPIEDMIVEAARGTKLRQTAEDTMLLGTAMAQHGAENLGELAEAMHPDDDAADLRAALRRAVTILILEEGQR